MYQGNYPNDVNHPVNYLQNTRILFSGIIKEMNLTLIENTQNFSHFCCLNRDRHNQKYRADLELKYSHRGINVCFSLDFKANIVFMNKSLEIQRDSINELNQKFCKIFILSFDSEKKVVRIKSGNFQIYNNPVIIEKIKEQFQFLQQKVIHSVFSVNKSQKMISKEDKIVNLRYMIEKNRKSKRKASKIDYIKVEDNQIKLDNFALFYSDFKKSSLSRIKAKSKNSPQIFRHLEIISTQQKKDQSCWKKQGGTSTLSLLNAEYKLFTLGSIHSNVQRQLQNRVAENSQSSTAQCQDKQSSQIEPKLLKEQEQKKITFEIKKSLLVAKYFHHEYKSVYLNQYNILATIRQEKCPNINSFYCQKDKTQSMNEQKVIYSNYWKNDLTMPISKKKNYLLITQNLAAGIIFLNTKKILHRDLKPDNILLDDELSPRLIDFGSSYFSKDYKGSRAGLTKDLMTTRFYNLFYSELPSSFKQLYNRYQFEAAPTFDIYSFGKIILTFFDDKATSLQLTQFAKQALICLGQMCSRINPQDRPDPIDVYIYIRLISQLITESSSH